MRSIPAMNAYDPSEGHAVKYGREITAELDKLRARYACDTGKVAYTECVIDGPSSSWWIAADPRYRVEVRERVGGIECRQEWPR